MACLSANPDNAASDAMGRHPGAERPDLAIEIRQRLSIRLRSKQAVRSQHTVVTAIVSRRA